MGLSFLVASLLVLLAAVWGDWQIATVGLVMAVVSILAIRKEESEHGNDD